jgi:hypothetical protein
MIDKLISSHLVALATEDRQCIPTLDALWAPPPVPRPPRATLGPWLAPVARAAPMIVVFATAGVLLEADLAVFNESPQLVIALVVAVMAMLGLAGSRPVKAGRPLADVVAASLFTVVAVTGFGVAWHLHRTDCVFFDQDGGSIGPCHAGRTLTTTWFVLSSFAAVLVISTVAARRIRRVGPRTWSIAAKVVMPTVLLTWVGVIQYWDRLMDVVRFQYAPWLHTPAPDGSSLEFHGGRFIEPHRVRVLFVDSFLGDAIRSSSEAGQWNAIEAGLVLLGLALSIGVACMRERGRPSRWLTLLESPLIIPLGVIVATGSLVLASLWQLFPILRGDWVDVRWFAACASVGAVVAFASMLLRRRRRETQS